MTATMDAGITSDMLVRALSDKLANPSSSDQEIFDKHLTWGQGLLQLQNRLTAIASINALNAGVLVGEKTSSAASKGKNERLVQYVHPLLRAARARRLSSAGTTG